jgi:hypothetical protein
MKFYPSDWQSDPVLRCCSIAARGLWVEMMCLMHKAEPYGSLLVNGARIDKRKLAILVGIPEKECTALLMELEGNGVFSRDDDGILYSRRMRRDFAKAETDKANGRRGGNPSVKGGVNPMVNGGDKAQKLEARDQNPEKKETRASALVEDGWPSDYREQFWDRYPNKVGKPKALAKLDLARKRGVPWSSIVDGLERYIRFKPPDRSWLNPETFINQERWTDQPAPTSQGNQNGRRTVHDAANDLVARVRALDEPAPGSLCERAGEGSVRLLPSRRC